MKHHGTLLLLVVCLSIISAYRTPSGLLRLPASRLGHIHATTTDPPSTTATPIAQTPTSSTSMDSNYDAQAITVLEGLDPVRKRPGMYIGSTGQRGLHHLVFEIVDNSVDESLAGHCTHIDVTLHADGSIEVGDNGRGIPCSLHPTTGKSALETVLCVLHAGGKFGGDDSGYKVSGGLHGVGISVVNALSTTMSVRVTRDNKLHSMSFAEGVPQGGLQVDPATDASTRGTRVWFQPDPKIFKTTLEFDFDKLSSRLDELAYLNAGLTISLTDRRSADGVGKDGDVVRAETYRHDGGIDELVREMCNEKVQLHPDMEVISVKDERKGVAVEVAMRWSKDMYTDTMVGFANSIRTSDGGSHMDGLKTAITKTVNNFARKSGKLKEGTPSIPGEFIREGLTAVVSVKVPEPEFEGQTKTRLGNPEVRTLVDSVVCDALGLVFDFNPVVLGAIVSKSMDAQAAALAARAARDMVRRKTLLTNTVLPGKLADCASRNPKDSEIYIVEGDSAAGSAKSGRDRKTQAILPLRGKILNIERASNEKIYQNTELQALISALGLGIRGTEFDSDSLRYHKIVIMTDADVDGAHIRLLLLTFFYRYQRELIAGGYVYIACPPLYKVTHNRKTRYLFDQQAYDDYMSGLGERATSSSVQTQRFKGLGEMMPTQLWETTMDPERRTLKLVTVEDAASADRLFDLLMGDKPNVRKEFIVENADKLQMDDLDF